MQYLIPGFVRVTRAKTKTVNHILMQIEFTGAFEGLRKDREGEVKLILAIPLSDEAKVREIPVQTTLKITIESEDE